MYYIYHIPGIKIGCTQHYPQRCIDQGFEDYELLESYDDGWLAGDVELKLQKEYGYTIDSCHYMISIQNLKPWNKESTHKGNVTKKSKGTLGKAWTLNRKLTIEQAEEIRYKYSNTKTSYKKLGAEYGVTHGVIYSILKNNSYKIK